MLSYLCDLVSVMVPVLKLKSRHIIQPTRNVRRLGSVHGDTGVTCGAKEYFLSFPLRVAAICIFCRASWIRCGPFSEGCLNLRLLRSFLAPSRPTGNRNSASLGFLLPYHSTSRTHRTTHFPQT